MKDHKLTKLLSSLEERSPKHSKLVRSLVYKYGATNLPLINQVIIQDLNKSKKHLDVSLSNLYKSCRLKQLNSRFL